MRKLTALDWVALALVVFGALVWGFIGVFSYDLVAALFGEMTVAARIIYSLVGMAAIYVLVIIGSLRRFRP